MTAEVTEDTVGHVHVSCARGREAGGQGSDTRCHCRTPQRRAHTKSRNGCGTCKRRRVKCDESRPICKNCARCSLPCDYDVRRTAPSAAEDAKTVRRKQGRPMKPWKPTPLTWLPSASETDFLLAKPNSNNQGQKEGIFDLNVDDLQLYHHYLTSTSLSLGADSLWKEGVPALAFEHHYVLRLVLAISAVHKAWKGHSDATKLYQLAEKHHNKALLEVTKLLPQINKANCSALYIATVLIFNYNLVKPPGKLDLRVSAERPELTWLTLFRGVRFTIETMGLEAIFSGHLENFMPKDWTWSPLSESDGGYIPWEKQLANLTSIFSQPSKSTSDLCVFHEGLIDCYHNVYGTAEQQCEHSSGKVAATVRWLWLIDDDFLLHLEQREPRVLILLAYFAVLLKKLECIWFFQGWSRYVMDDVMQNLDATFSEWIVWPQAQIG